MPKMIDEMSVQECMELSELWRLETLLTKNVHILRLNLPSRDKLVIEIKKEIKKIQEG